MTPPPGIWTTTGSFSCELIPAGLVMRRVTWNWTSVSTLCLASACLLSSVKRDTYNSYNFTGDTALVKLCNLDGNEETYMQLTTVFTLIRGFGKEGWDTGPQLRTSRAGDGGVNDTTFGRRIRSWRRKPVLAGGVMGKPDVVEILYRALLCAPICDLALLKCDCWISCKGRLNTEACKGCTQPFLVLHFVSVWQHRKTLRWRERLLGGPGEITVTTF
jgi:hypothetical protein